MTQQRITIILILGVALRRGGNTRQTFEIEPAREVCSIMTMHKIYADSFKHEPCKSWST